MFRFSIPLAIVLLHFAGTAIPADSNSKPYKVVGEIPKETCLQIEAALTKEIRRGGGRILHLKAEKDGAITAQVGQTQGPIIVSCRVYSLKKSDGKWLVVSVHYLII